MEIGTGQNFNCRDKRIRERKAVAVDIFKNKSHAVSAGVKRIRDDRARHIRRFGIKIRPPPFVRRLFIRFEAFDFRREDDRGAALAGSFG